VEVVVRTGRREIRLAMFKKLLDVRALAWHRQFCCARD
jgi:hypothetical protein